jgi:hypothetical protein
MMERNSRRYQGRWLSSVAGGAILTLAVAGCASLNPYPQAGAHMLEKPHGKFCWVPKGSPIFGHRENCANDQASPSLKKCLDKLERNSHWYSPSDEAEGNILQCMNDEGWGRSLIEGFIVTPG